MDHKRCLEKLAEYQEAERDSRRLARESITFLYEEGGHWEENAKKFFKDRPQYQFDHCYPVYSAIANELKSMSIGMQALEAGNGSSSEVAETFDGMLMSTQAMSGFRFITADTIDSVVCSGFDAWVIRNDWATSDSFDQDLLIDRVQDSINRVWIGPTEKSDMSDAQDAFIVTKISKDEYEKDYPDASGLSVDREEDDDYRAVDTGDIAVADYYYLKYEDRTIFQLSDGSTMFKEDFERQQAYLPGVEVARQRDAEVARCYIRRMDGGDWLGEAKETPFAFVPVVGIYANYTVRQGRRIYFGVIEKLKDPQRVYDYAGSREVSDGALSPNEKIGMTPKQGVGHEEQNSMLNSAAEPILFYNPDSEAMTPPFKLPGNQPSPHLQITQQNRAQDIITTSSQYEPSRGEGLSNTSGKAYEILQAKSNLSAGPFSLAIERGANLAAKILIDAYPRVYDTRSRQVRLLNEDGTSKFEAINAELPNGEVVRDLSKGKYDVSVGIGQAFSSRKNEGIKAIMELGQYYPDIFVEGGDIITKSLDAPYIDQIAKRIRKRKVDGGEIPESQLTDEEREKIMQEMERAANQPPDPMQEATIAAIMAESQKATMEAQKTQQDMQIAMMEQLRKMEETQAKILEMHARTQQAQAQTVRDLTHAEDENNMPGNSGNEAAERVSKGIN